MEEEDTREVLLPNWQGSGSMGITLDQNDDGVYVKQLAQNSPAAKTGVMKEGDQIVGATVYFDNMSSEDIQRLLANVGQHTVGLKLQRKGDRSPQPGMSWSHDVFSLKSPDVVLSGDDEDYRRIYTKKIKPRLKSDDSLESETQTRTISVTRKVTAYTVDVSGSKDSKEIDINSPEYKIKVPRREVTEISKTSMDTGGGKTVIRIPGAGIGEQHFLTTRTDVSRPGDSVSVHTTNVHHYEHSGGVSDFPDIHTDSSIRMTSRSSGLAEFPDINISGPTFQSYDRKVDMKSSRFEIDPEVSLRGPNVAGASSLDINMKNPAIATDLDQTTKSTLDFHRQQPSLESPTGGFQSSVSIKGPQFDIKKPSGLKVDSSATGINLKGDTNLSAQKTKIGIAVPAMSEYGSGKGTMDSQVDLTVPTQDIVKGLQTDSDGFSGKVQIPALKIPKFGFSETKSAAVESAVNLQTSVSASTSAITRDIHLASSQLEGKIDAPSANIRAPTFAVSSHTIETSAVDVRNAKGKLDTQSPMLELKGPGGNVKSPSVKMPSVNVDLPNVNEVNLKTLDGKVTIPKLKMPKFGMSDVEAGGSIINNISKGDVAIAVPKTDINMPSMQDAKFSMQPMQLPKVPLPDVDISVKGTKLDGGLKGPIVSTRGLGVKLDAPDIDGEIRKPAVSLGAPSVDKSGKLKDQTITIDPIDYDKKYSNLKGDFSVEMKGPGLALDIPDADVKLKQTEGNFQIPTFKMPKFSVSEKPFDLEGKMKGPKIDVMPPDVNLDAPNVNLESQGKLEMPKFSMPKFGVSGTNIECPDIDIKLPKGVLDVSGPRVAVDVPNVDVEGPEGKIKNPKFGIPSMDVDLTKLSMPNNDLNLKSPKVEGDFKGPQVDVKGPKIAVDSPDVHLEGKLKGPKFSMPSMPNIDLNLKGPKGETRVPQVDPDVDIDGKVKGSKFKMPNIHVPKISMPSIDLKGPKLESELKGGKVDLPVPEMELDAPDADLGVKGKFKMPKFHMPKFGVPGPKIECPDVDISLPKGDLDVSGSRVEVDVPNLDVEGPEGKIKGPKFGMPSMDFNLPKFSKPNIDINLKSPKVEVEGDFKGPQLDIKGPKVDQKVEGNLKFPKADVDASEIDIDGKVKGTSFKMPSMKLPDFDLNLKGPNWKGDAFGPKMERDLGGKKVDIELAGPKLDSEVPDLDIKGPKGKIGSELKMPSLKFDLPKVSIPDIDLNLKGPNWSGGTDVSIPNFKGDLRGPNAAIEKPDVDIEGPDGKFKMPKFKMPKFGVSVPRVDTDMNVALEKSEMDVSGPKTDLESPEVEGKLKGPKINIPSINLNLPNINMSDFDINVKGPKMKGDVQLSGPKVGATDLAGNVHLKNPNVDFKTPDVNIEAQDVTLKGPGMDIEGPEGNLKMPKMKKSKFGFGMKSPKAEVKPPSLDVRTPDMEFDADVPELDLESKGKKGKFKMPKIHMSGPKIKGKKGGFDVSTPDAESDLNLNATDDMNLSGGGADLGIKAPKSRKPLFGKIYFPDVEFDLKSPKLKGDAGIHSPKADIKTPGIDFEGDLKTPEGDLKTPEGELSLRGVDIDGSDIKVKKSKFKLPTFNLSGPKVSEGDLRLSGPKVTGELNAPSMDVNLSTSDINLKAPSVSVDPSLSGISVPDVNVDMKGPTVRGDLDVSGNLDTDISGASGKVKIPKFSIPKFGLSSHSAHGSYDVSTPDLEGNLKGPSIDMSLPKVSNSDFEMHLSGPKIKSDMDISNEFNGGKFDIGLPSARMKGLDANVTMPNVDLSGPRLHGPDNSLHGNVSVSGPKLEFPDASSKIEIPYVNVTGKDSEVKVPKAHLKGNVEGFKIGVEKSERDLYGVSLGGDLSENLIGGVQFEGREGLQISGPNTDAGQARAGINFNTRDGYFGEPVGVVTFPRLLMPKFTSSGPELTGREVGVDVDFPKSNVSLGKPGKADIELEESDIKIKKSKIKMPKFNFSKAKGKSDASLSEVSVTESKGDLKHSKASLGSVEGAVGSAGLEVGSGGGISSKEKSGRYEFSLFTSSKSRHRSSSLSEEMDSSTQSSPSGTLEAQDGGVALEGSKKKGKHSKIKFGTFGGIGSKSKGSYEVTLSDDENVQGSGASLSSRKSRVSSSSSNDSATKAGLQMPKVELTVAKKK